MPKPPLLALLVSLVAMARAASAEPASVPAPSAAPAAAPAPAPTATPLSAPAATPAPSPLAPARLPLSVFRAHAPIAVAIVVDQLAAWVLRERIDRLAPDGGFARLRREGKYFPEMAFAHAATETGPGHASLFTGRLPREHGIVANDVIAPDGRQQSILADTADVNQLVDLDGNPIGRDGVSLDALEGKSNLIAAVFRSRYPKGQGIVAALSLKERGALFAAGETGDYAVWFDPKLGADQTGRARGGFVTTRRYPAAFANGGLGTFLGGYLATGPEDRRGGVARVEERTWTGLDPAWLGENVGIARDSDYTGFLLSHTASQARQPGAAFRALPDSDRLLLELALRILKDEPANLPVFLSVSLSANDYIGHLFGPDSWEAWDELRRLDATLAWFFRELDSFGPQAWSVVLTADHGTAAVEDDPKRPACPALPKAALDVAKACSGQAVRGARIHGEDLVREAEMAAPKAGVRDAAGRPVDKIVAGIIPPFVYLTEAARTALAADPAARRRLSSRLDGDLRRRFKTVHAVVDAAAFKDEAECPDERTDRLTALVCNSISPAPDRGGDFYIVLKPGAFVDPDMVEGMGAMHGSPYGYDRVVPLLVRDPGRPELAGQTDETRMPYTQFRDELVRIILSAPSLPR